MNKTQVAIHAYNARKHALEGIYNAQSGHPGGSLSICDILSVLYFEVMNIDPKDPKNPERDRFVLSKGHCAPALYGILSERGYFPTEDCAALRRTDSYIQGHPDMKGVPGVDMSTGSLGQGISAACGMALAAKKTDKDYRVYAILGDGELEEGQVWEAAMFAAHYKLDNLTAFIDNNGLQIDGNIDTVMSPNPIDEKFRAFGWNVIAIDAHDYDAVQNAVNAAKTVKGKPTMVLARSVKGKGVSFMENNPAWHGAAPKKEQYELAISELDAKIAELKAGGTK
ncbi:MAG: transketolase [Clostridia bacterium]|nr:transketolase [Clostridia bacterium]